MRYLSKTMTSLGVSDWISLDVGDSLRRGAFYTLGLVIDGTLTASVEFALNPILTDASVYQHPILKDLTSSHASDLGFPASAFRINVTSYASGSVTLELLQASLK